MPRRTFDLLVSAAGLLLVVILLVAGALLTWAYRFADSNVSDQLSAQMIYFPEAGSEGLEGLPPADRDVIAPYAGQQLTDGRQAEAYANHYIAVHLEDTADGMTYAEASTLARQNPDDEELAGQVQTLFRGESLRGVLLTTYAFWTFGQIAFWAAIASFAAAGFMLILTGLGFWHARKVPPTEQILGPPAERVPAESTTA